MVPGNPPELTGRQERRKGEVLPMVSKAPLGLVQNFLGHCSTR